MNKTTILHCTHSISRIIFFERENKLWKYALVGITRTIRIPFIRSKKCTPIIHRHCVRWVLWLLKILNITTNEKKFKCNKFDTRSTCTVIIWHPLQYKTTSRHTSVTDTQPKEMRLCVLYLLFDVNPIHGENRTESKIAFKRKSYKNK